MELRGRLHRLQRFNRTRVYRTWFGAAPAPGGAAPVGADLWVQRRILKAGLRHRRRLKVVLCGQARRVGVCGLCVWWRGCEGGRGEAEVAWTGAPARPSVGKVGQRGGAPPRTHLHRAEARGAVIGVGDHGGRQRLQAHVPPALPLVRPLPHRRLAQRAPHDLRQQLSQRRVPHVGGVQAAAQAGGDGAGGWRALKSLPRESVPNARPQSANSANKLTRNQAHAPSNAGAAL